VPEKPTQLASGRRPPASDFTEASLIDYIRSRLPPPPGWLRVPIGDDAAVLEPERGTLEVLTTDTLVEGVHFDFALSAPADVGAKALAVNLSDLAAMGAAPRAALLSLSLPASFPRSRLEPLLDALVDAARQSGTSIAGGNVTGSPGPLVITIAAIGSVRPRRALLRSGAKPNDEVYVSGAVGAGAAGLGFLRERRHAAGGSDGEACVAWYRRPEPRLRLGLLLGRTRTATACIDLSDGLAEGARQIGAASGVGICLDADAVPVHPGARRYFEERGLDPVTAALAGGDDYELLFTVPSKRRRSLERVAALARGLPVKRIGTVTTERAFRLRRDGSDEPLPPGYEHFSHGSRG
jgi:thiamine-monophosphate kinase